MKRKGGKTIKSFLITGNIVVSGLVAFIISWFFAEGAIGDTDSFTPQFFLILPIWFIGVLMRLRMVAGDMTSYFHILFNNLLLWATIPIGLVFSQIFI